MTRKSLTLLLGLLLAATTAHAKDIEIGTVEIAGRTSAAFAIDLDEDNTLSLGTDGYYYLMPDVGVGAFLDFTKTFGDADAYSFGIGPQAIYNYSLDEVTSLYGRAGLGYLQADSDAGDSASGWTFVMAGGAKYFVTENVSVNGELNYTHDGGDFDSNLITALFGISVYLR